MSLWGLPMPVVHAVSYHHDPGLIPGQTFCALAAVHIANSLLESSRNDQDIVSSPLDMNYLKSINLLDRLPAWRKLVQTEGRHLQRFHQDGAGEDGSGAWRR
jgi:hypothetical protein